MQNTFHSKKNKSYSEKELEQAQIPPHSIEAEQAIIGGLLLNNNHWDNIAGQIIADDFYTYQHRLIFEEINNLFRLNQPVDLLTVENALKNKSLLEQVGGFAYLAELSNSTPNTSNILAYANIVRDNAVLRELISTANTISKRCFNLSGQDVKDILDQSEQDIFNIAEKRESNNEGPQNVVPILENTIAKIEKLHNSKDNSGVTGLSTGFDDLDRKTAGLQPSDLIIIAARPSMGKTTFAMNLCENAALAPKNDKPVLVFSLEMPAEQLMMRTLASLSQVDQTKIRTGRNLSPQDFHKMAGVIGQFNQKNNLFIDDSSGLTPNELRARARRIYREHGGLSLIMVDYLQLMRAPGFADNRTLEIAEISRSLKALAKELEVPVIALSQLNRSLENRGDKRPINSDLRESGSIEQDADLIMFIYRDEVYNENSDQRGVAEIIIGKQRNGPIGTTKLTFQGNISHFSNFAEPQNYNRDV